MSEAASQDAGNPPAPASRTPSAPAGAPQNARPETAPGKGRGGERVVLSLRPHPLYIVLRSLGPLLWIAVLSLAMAWLASIGVIGAGAAVFLLAGLLAALMVLAWRAGDWATRRFTLTAKDGGRRGGRVEASWGVVRRSTVEAPVHAVRSIVLHQSARERVFGLGSLGFATAATGGVEVAWWMVARPRQLLETVRGEMNAARTRAGEREPGDPSPALMPIIGLAGGIGAGKSHLAAALARLGCVVVDSDAEAKQALDLPAVRQQLVEWFGQGLLNEQGTIDRRALAAVVFEDEGARRRLEGLVHPIVKRRRAEQVAAARAAGAPAVVIDAPLLFEAGVDEECDFIVFVDAPPELRLDRVRSRGWDEAELARRERWQWDLERKRAASDLVVKNADATADLEGEAKRILRSAASRVAGSKG